MTLPAVGAKERLKVIVVPDDGAVVPTSRRSIPLRVEDTVGVVIERPNHRQGDAYGTLAGSDGVLDLLHTRAAIDDALVLEHVLLIHHRAVHVGGERVQNLVLIERENILRRPACLVERREGETGVGTDVLMLLTHRSASDVVGSATARNGRSLAHAVAIFPDDAAAGSGHLDDARLAGGLPERSYGREKVEKGEGVRKACNAHRSASPVHDVTRVRRVFLVAKRADDHRDEAAGGAEEAGRVAATTAPVS